MLKTNTGRIFFSLFKVAAFLGVGAMIGFCLGLAYASHLYGTPPVVIQIQNWLAGDTLYERPLPIDESERFGSMMNTPVAVIPRIGACIGFAMAVSVYVSSLFLKAFAKTVSKNNKPRKA